MTNSNNIVNIIVDDAFTFAEQLNHEFVTLDHVLNALLSNPSMTSKLAGLGVEVEAMRKANIEFIETDISKLDEKQPARKTRTIERVFNRAFVQNIFLGNKADLMLELILVSIMLEEQSHAAYLCFKHGLTKDLLIPGAGSAQDTKQASALELYTSNLTDPDIAESMDDVIGRQYEIESLVQTLARKKKSNAILVGDPGVGKTAIVEGLARRIVTGDVPVTLIDAQIYSLNVSSLMASSKFRGDLEERVQRVLVELKAIDNPVLFIDEIHMIMKAGASNGSAMDIANILKPELQRGHIHCIGSTTYTEFQERFEKDPALVRRFHKIDVVEPTAQEAKDILRQSIPSYSKFHGMKIKPAAIDLAVDLSIEFMHTKRLPDKAFDLIDSAFARQRTYPTRKTAVITESHIMQELSRLARVPLEIVTNVSKKDAAPTIDIEKGLSAKVFGQAEAITALSDAIYITQAGLKDPEKPMGSYLFTGPTGVGKTESVKALGALLGMPVVRFDMSEFIEQHSVARLIGAPPGYVGFDSGSSGALIDALEKTPNCILLLDEVEKAHKDVLNIMLQLMDNGMVTGSNSKVVSGRNALLVMTSNLGAAQADKQHIGFGNKENTAQADAMTSFFAPEFRNRLDAVVQFNKLGKVSIHKIATKFMLEVAAYTEKRNIKLTWTPSVISWLADKGFDPVMGARPMSRAIHEHVKKPLAKKMLFGKNIKSVKLKIANGSIMFEEDM
jgi:ATP-dependent Clp protease ATP-binding subunit ClpA